MKILKKLNCKNDSRPSFVVYRQSFNEQRKPNNVQRTTEIEQRTVNMECKLQVWKLAHQLTLDVYRVSKQFPSSEKYGLTNQVRRSASSVPTNIIEGQGRQYKKEFIQFLYIAKGSLEEANYQLFLAKDLEYISNVEYVKLFDLCTRIKMMLYKLIKSLK